MSASTPALAAAYWTYSPGEPSVAAPELMLTRTPPEPPRDRLIDADRGPRHEQRRGEVEVDRRAYDVGRGVGERAEVQRRAGVVDHPGQLAGRREQLVDAGVGGEVGADGRAVDPELAARRLRAGRRRVVAGVAQHEVVAVGGEAAGDGRADAAGAAGDEGAHGRCLPDPVLSPRRPGAARGGVRPRESSPCTPRR